MENVEHCEYFLHALYFKISLLQQQLKTVIPSPCFIFQSENVTHHVTKELQCANSSVQKSLLRKTYSCIFTPDCYKVLKLETSKMLNIFFQKNFTTDLLMSSIHQEISCANLTNWNQEFNRDVVSKDEND